MKQRDLGRTGVRVGEVGLGTEHLHGQPRQTVIEVIREAVDRGVTYFDILWSYPDYLDNLGAAFAGLRDRVILTLHLGATVTHDGQYQLSRDVEKCATVFAEMLERLGTEHADAVLIQWVDKEDDYERIGNSGGLLEVARTIRGDGRARLLAQATPPTISIASAAMPGGESEGTGLGARSAVADMSATSRPSGLGLSVRFVTLNSSVFKPDWKPL